MPKSISPEGLRGSDGGAAAGADEDLAGAGDGPPGAGLLGFDPEPWRSTGAGFDGSCVFCWGAGGFSEGAGAERGRTRPGANSSRIGGSSGFGSAGGANSATGSAGSPDTVWIGLIASSVAVLGDDPSAVSEPFACSIAAVPAMGDRPRAKMTTNAAAQTIAAATR